ncbi:hypothetical protein ILYODFUR_018086 [Ilyodon furcidens]|uniref:N-terminal EF-hand calcium binding protein 3 n=1 Tax=Ilyodon furcidens TaxID=33524 RepID=A0ABV0TBY3_9TELE
MEEFQSYFTDGILTEEQMQELYYSIDRQQTDNLDIDKLSAYFTPHLGEYVNVLSALEKLNVAILKAMDKTKEEYQGSSVLGQFVTRFLLRETSSQLQSLQSSLDCATEAVHDHGCTGRRVVKKPEDLPIQRVIKRPNRRIQKNMCLSPTDPYSGMLTTGVSVEPDNHWGYQINQLEQLMDKLDCESPRLEPLKEDTLAGTYKSNILLVQRQMSVKERDMEQFQQTLKIYTDDTSSQLDNLQYVLLASALFSPQDHSVISCIHFQLLQFPTDIQPSHSHCPHFLFFCFYCYQHFSPKLARQIVLHHV